nr:hypothetical protein [Tanacetum cinerariifolium]
MPYVFALARGKALEKVTATDLFYLRSMDRGAANVSYLLAQYLFRHAEGRKNDAMLVGGHFIGRLAHHFGLVSDDGLRGLSIVTREISLIDMESQPNAMAGTLEDAPAVDEDAQADPAHVSWRLAGRLIRRLMGPFEGAHQQTKTGSKLNTIVREYVTELSTLSKSRAKLEDRVFTRV